MEQREYRTTDRTGWPRGPWDQEPDKVQWSDQTTGLPCLAVRHLAWGHWCGYVGVPPGHPYHGKPTSDLQDLNVHGGLTYADRCMQPNESHPDVEATGICHVPGPGEPHDVWWLGFDCHHAFDLAPLYGRALPPHLQLMNSRMDHTYRTLEYVRTQCASLAVQLS